MHSCIRMLKTHHIYNWSGLVKGKSGNTNRATTINPAAAAMRVALLSWGRVSVSSRGSTAQTLLFPSTSRYTPSMERVFGELSRAESSRRVRRISAAEVVGWGVLGWSVSGVGSVVGGVESGGVCMRGRWMRLGWGWGRRMGVESGDFRERCGRARGEARGRAVWKAVGGVGMVWEKGAWGFVGYSVSGCVGREGERSGAKGNGAKGNGAKGKGDEGKWGEGKWGDEKEIGRAHV